MASLNCPVCSSEMHEVEKHGVNIDTCPKCRGVWLDRGELEKLGERLVGSARGSAVPVVEDRHRDRDRNRSWDRDDDRDRDDRDRDDRYRSDRRRFDSDDDDDRRRGPGEQRSGFSRFMEFFD